MGSGSVELRVVSRLGVCVPTSLERERAFRATETPLRRVLTFSQDVHGRIGPACPTCLPHSKQSNGRVSTIVGLSAMSIIGCGAVSRRLIEPNVYSRSAGQTGMTTPAPGWYPDPWKLAPNRYWDGSGWTGATDISATPTSQVPPAQFPPPTTDRDKGAALEQQVARFLRSSGYEARTNVILTGRSGASHELDVVGEKHDSLTSFLVAVECKAWEQPIEKDVVAKFAYVLGDLGMRAGIIACLSGYRSGAEIAAKEMNIELWGPDELRSRLGQVALSDMSTRAPKRLATGLPFTISIEQAQPMIGREAKGKLGFGAEEVVWISAAWLPVAIVQVALTSIEGRLKKVDATRRIWNVYELVDGKFFGAFAGQPPLVDIDLGKVSIRPKRKEASASKAIEEAVAKYRGVTTQAARARHASHLESLGIHAPFRAVPESTTTAFMPVYLAIIRRRDGERLVAVDGHQPRVLYGVSAVLSQHIHWVRESFGA